MEIRPPQPGNSIPAQTPKQVALEAAGREFERLLVEQMLVSMQSTLNEGLFAGTDAGGTSSEWYTSLFNQEVSKEISAGPGIGLAASMLEQLRRQSGVTEGNATGATMPDSLSGEPADSLRAGGISGAGLPWQCLASLDRAFTLRRQELDPGVKNALGRLEEVGQTARASFRRPETDRIRELRALVSRVATEEGVDPKLAQALVETESGWDEHARSRKGALGLTQLMPDTARGLGVKDPLDAAQNVRGGMRYLRQMLDRFQDRRLALAAYNAGPGAVARHDGVPPYAETRAYVARIEKLVGEKP